MLVTVPILATADAPLQAVLLVQVPAPQPRAVLLGPQFQVLQTAVILTAVTVLAAVCSELQVPVAVVIVAAVATVADTLAVAASAVAALAPLAEAVAVAVEADVDNSVLPWDFKDKNRLCNFF